MRTITILSADTPFRSRLLSDEAQSYLNRYGALFDSRYVPDTFSQGAAVLFYGVATEQDNRQYILIHRLDIPLIDMIRSVGRPGDNIVLKMLTNKDFEPTTQSVGDYTVNITPLLLDDVVAALKI